MKKTPAQPSILFRLLGFLKPRTFVYVASLFGLALIYTTERVFIAYVIKLFVDSITSKNIDQLWYSVRLWGIFLVFWIPAGVALSYVWRKTTLKAIAALRENIFTHVQRLPLGYHEERHSGDLVSVLTNDVTAAEQAFEQDMLNLVNATMQGIAAAVFTLILNWQLALVVIATGFIPLIVNAAFASPLRKAGEIIQNRLGEMSEKISDLLAGYQVVRSYSLAEWILSRFENSNRRLLTSSLRRVRLNAALEAANGLGFIGFIAMLGIGGYMVLNDFTTFGTLIALTQLSGSLQFFVYSVGGTIARIQSSLAAAQRIIAVLDAATEPDIYTTETRAAILPGAKNALLEFNDVTFTYADGIPVLDHMSFTVQRGQVAAFVGPSGGGKSTIFKLLLGCYPVQRGAVFVEGHSINNLLLAGLRDQFAYIPQNAFLYAGTVYENISYGKPGATREEVIRAAKAANAHDFIMEFDQDYNTKIGELGVRLSGGQRQRIAIARALLKDAPILLLDEATSALDSESEVLVQQALAVLMQNRTVLVIAHRLTTIDNADIIYVVDHGTVVESGTQQQLLQNHGLFHHLHQLQFRDETQEPAENIA